MLRPNVLKRLLLPLQCGRRPRRRLTPVVRPLEGRRLLSAPAAGAPPPSAVMTQTATFPNLESLPNVSTQAILYFSSRMGTLTEVDLVTSGSFNSEFYAENLGSSSSTIEGTTSGNLSVNVPTGSIPVTIPSVTQTFDAQPFDGTLDYGGTSGKDFAPVTSSATPQTTVLTSPADLAAFTGNFRIPISVSGHATGSATSDNGNLSAGFKTQTSATITVIYDFIPDLPSLDPSPNTSPSSQPPGGPASANGMAPSGSPASSSSGGTNSGLVAPTGAVPGASSFVQPPSTQHHASTSLAKKKEPKPAAGASRGHGASRGQGQVSVFEQVRRLRGVSSREKSLERLDHAVDK
jgi:hypothetical protein